MTGVIVQTKVDVHVVLQQVLNTAVPDGTVHCFNHADAFGMLSIALSTPRTNTFRVHCAGKVMSQTKCSEEKNYGYYGFANERRS